MCLAVVTCKKFKSSDKCKIRYGWKVFWREAHGQLVCPLRPCQFSDMPTNRWITDGNEGTLMSHDGHPYSTGFHIFKKKKDAIKSFYNISVCNCVLKVVYLNVVATGFDSIHGKEPIIVARQIKILS